MDAAERQRLNRLLDALEERFIMGEVSEGAYTELRDKYRQRLTQE